MAFPYDLTDWPASLPASLRDASEIRVAPREVITNTVGGVPYSRLVDMIGPVEVSFTFRWTRAQFDVFTAAHDSNPVGWWRMSLSLNWSGRQDWAVKLVNGYQWKEEFFQSEYALVTMQAVCIPEN